MFTYEPSRIVIWAVPKENQHYGICTMYRPGSACAIRADWSGPRRSVLGGYMYRSLTQKTHRRHKMSVRVGWSGSILYAKSTMLVFSRDGFRCIWDTSCVQWRLERAYASTKSHQRSHCPHACSPVLDVSFEKKNYKRNPVSLEPLYLNIIMIWSVNKTQTHLNIKWDNNYFD